MSDQTKGFIGGAIAIAFGAALLWLPPAQLAGQAATIGAGFTFVTAGLAAFGVSATVPAATRAARSEGMRTAAAADAPKKQGRPPLQ